MALSFAMLCFIGPVVLAAAPKELTLDAGDRMPAEIIPGTRVVIRGRVTVANNVTIPTGATLRVEPGGLLAFAPGRTLRVEGRVESAAPGWLRDALDGGGRAAFSETAVVEPDWWRANRRPGDTDMSVALQAAIESGAGTIRLGPAKYRLAAVVEIARSDVRLVGTPDTVLHVTRPTPMNVSQRTRTEPAPRIKESYGLVINGPVSQRGVGIASIRFTGTGYWGGIYSSLHYPHDGWGPGGYPNVDEDAYRTARRDCRFSELRFDSPYYESIALTCVAASLEDIQVRGGRNARNHGNIVVRYAQNVVIRKVRMEGCANKHINTSYLDAVDISEVEITDARGGADGVGVYIGHFSRKAKVSDVRISTTHPFEEFVKVSYYATGVEVRDSDFSGPGYIMVQAARQVRLARLQVRTTGPRALQLVDYSGPPEPALSPEAIEIVDCVFASSAASDRRVVDLSHGRGVTFASNHVAGNIYANPVRGLHMLKNIVAHEAAAAVPSNTADAAIYLQDAAEGEVVLESNEVAVRGAAYVLYLNGAKAPARVRMTGNDFRPGTLPGFQVVANYVTTGAFYFRDNEVGGRATRESVYVNYEDAAGVVLEP